MIETDNIELDNGRRVTLTDGGWEVHPWRGDKTAWYFDTLEEAKAWGRRCDEWGNRRKGGDER